MKNKNFHRFIFLLLIAFFVFGLSLGCVNGAENIRAGEAADFRLKNLEGSEVALSDSRGKPVILFFWTSWCYHCVRSLPALRRLRKESSQEELEILAVNIEESHSRVKRFAQKYKANYKILLDEDGRVSNLYNVYGIPAVIVVDEQGFIRSRGSRLPRRLDRLLEGN